MLRLDLVVMCIVAVIFLLRVLVGLLQEWMTPAAHPRRMHVATFYPSRKRGQLFVIPVNPPKHQFSSKDWRTHCAPAVGCDWNGDLAAHRVITLLARPM